MTEDQIIKAKVVGCLAALIMFIICIIYYEKIFMERKLHDVKEDRNDFLSLTPADYSVLIYLSDK
jgi:hypothetical protein